MAIALDIPWDVLRAEFSLGVSIPQLADKYGVATGTLCSRAAREKWMELRPQTHAMSAIEAQRVASKNVGMDLATRGQAYAERMFAKTSVLAEAADIKQIRSVKDLEIIDRIARRAAGLEHAEVSINTVIGVGGITESLDGGPTFEMETVSQVSLESGSTEES